MKKVLIFILAVVLMIGMVPVNAFAQEMPGGQPLPAITETSSEVGAVLPTVSEAPAASESPAAVESSPVISASPKPDVPPAQDKTPIENETYEPVTDAADGIAILSMADNTEENVPANAGTPKEPVEEPTFGEGTNVNCTFYITMKGFGADVDTIQPTPSTYYVRAGSSQQGSMTVPHGMVKTSRGYGRALSLVEYENGSVVTSGKPVAAQIENTLTALAKKVSTPEQPVVFPEGTQIYWNVIKYDPTDGWHIDGYVVKPTTIEYANVTYDYGIVDAGSVIGKPANNPVQVKTGADVPMPEISAHGYEFLGWAYGGTVTDALKMPAMDITLTAQWKEIKYGVTFAAAAGGSFAPDAQTTFGDISYGTAWSSALTAPTPLPDEGYYFAGWSDSFPAKVTETKTYTAKFERLIPVTLTANSKTVNYNGESQVLTGFTGTPKGITVTRLTASGNGRNASEPAYQVIFQGSPVFTDANGNDVTDHYKVTYRTGQLLIKKVPLTITANNAQRMYGEPNPQFDFSANGFQGADTAQDIGLTVSYSCAADENSPAGSNYPVMPSGKAESVNYVIRYEDGRLDVLKSDKLDVTAVPYAGTYDAQNHAGLSNVAANITGGTNITYSTDGVNYKDAVPQFKNAGSYTIYVKAENANYEDAVRQFEVVIAKAPLTITAMDKSKAEGEADPALTAAVAGLKGDGALSYTLHREVGETAGTYAINVFAIDDPNYEITLINGTFTIQVVPVTPDDPNRPVSPPVTPADPGQGTGGGDVPVVPPVTPAAPNTLAPDTAPVAAAILQQPATANTQDVLIPEQQTPLAAGTAQDDAQEEVNIEDPQVPLASGSDALGNAHWALLNLILAIATAIVMIVLLIGYFIGKKHKKEDGQEEENQIKRRGIARLLSILPGVGAVIAFLLTEDMSLPMQFTDEWTLLMAVIAIVQAVVIFFTFKKHKDEQSQASETPTI